MNLDIIYQELQQVRVDIKQLRQEVARYKGFIHGVLWCLGTLAAVLS